MRCLVEMTKGGLVEMTKGVCRAVSKKIVALALLPLDVCIPAARASEHVHHCAIQDMLRRVFLGQNVNIHQIQSL